MEFHVDLRANTDVVVLLTAFLILGCGDLSIENICCEVSGEERVLARFQSDRCVHSVDSEHVGCALKPIKLCVFVGLRAVKPFFKECEVACNLLWLEAFHGLVRVVVPEEVLLGRNLINLSLEAITVDRGGPEHAYNFFSFVVEELYCVSQVLEADPSGVCLPSKVDGVYELSVGAD